jgi:hypothetical protein
MSRIKRRLKRWQPLSPMREWRRADGAELVAMHPLYAVMWEHYAPELEFDSAAKVVGRRLREIVRGERRLPEAVAGEVVELDREQRENGCPDENIAGLVALLREGGAR